MGGGSSKFRRMIYDGVVNIRSIPGTYEAITVSRAFLERCLGQ